MLARLLAARDDREDGFTLVEILIVIIIIGILASIAIPIFLTQRSKGYDAAAKSDLKGMQVAEESYFTDYSSYTATVSGAAGLTGEGFKASLGPTDTVVGTGGASYCLKSVSQSGTSYYLGNSSGGPTTTACTTS